MNEYEYGQSNFLPVGAVASLNGLSSTLCWGLLFVEREGVTRLFLMQKKFLYTKPPEDSTTPQQVAGWYFSNLVNMSQPIYAINSAYPLCITTSIQMHVAGAMEMGALIQKSHSTQSEFINGSQWQKWTW